MSSTQNNNGNGRLFDRRHDERTRRIAVGFGQRGRGGSDGGCLVKVVGRINELATL